jgi:hypothetical protein
VPSPSCALHGSQGRGCGREGAVATIRQAQHRGHQDRTQRWTRLDRADLVAWYGRLPAQGGASRHAATGLAVPRSAPQAWCLSHDRLDACPAVVTCCHMPWNVCCAAVRGARVRDVERTAQPEPMASVHTRAWRLHAPTYRHVEHTTRRFSALARRSALLYRRHALAYTARHWQVCGRDPGVLPL